MKIRPASYEDALPMAQVIVDTFLSSNRGIMSEEAWLKRKQEWTYEDGEAIPLVIYDWPDMQAFADMGKEQSNPKSIEEGML